MVQRTPVQARAQTIFTRMATLSAKPVFEMYVGTQTEWMPHRDTDLLDAIRAAKKPRLNLRQRLTGAKLYAIEIRMQPSSDLAEFGALFAEKTGLKIEVKPGDKAIYNVGWSYGLWIDYLDALLRGEQRNFLDGAGAGLRVWRVM
jgi:hypothetical protein